MRIGWFGKPVQEPALPVGMKAAARTAAVSPQAFWRGFLRICAATVGSRGKSCKNPPKNED